MLDCKVQMIFCNNQEGKPKIMLRFEKHFSCCSCSNVSLVCLEVNEDFKAKRHFERFSLSL